MPMATLAQTACFRCRGQKLRCSREQPICARCKRLNAVCVFPDPPSRKARKAQARLSRDSVAIEHEAPDSNHVTQALAIANTIDLTQDSELLLVDIFFLSFFNSTLMFHRPTFIQALTDGSIARHTLLAVFAFATHFIDSSLTKATFDSARIEAIRDAKAIGKRCAEEATTEVMKHVISPTLETCRTCMLLSLYYFSQGDSMRNSMLAGIAQKGARSVCQETASTEASKSWLQLESERRCLWVAWMSNLVNADHYINGTSADSYIMNLPLPTSMDAFENVRQEPVSTLSGTSELEGVIKPRPAPWSSNTRAELMRLILHWAKIQDHIEARKRISAKTALVELLDLDHWLLNFAKGIPSEMGYSKRNLYEFMAVKRQTCFPKLHIMIHICRLILHASIVPQFGGAFKQEISPETVKISAETALNQANAIANIADDMIALELDPSQFAPIVGYCMYVAATIHIVFLAATNQTLATNAKKGLTATLRVLKPLKRYWPHLQRLWARVHVLYEAQLSRMSSLKQQNGFITSRDDLSEMDVIVNSERDVGRLTEPLSESVLRYSLRSLKQTLVIDETSPSAQDLEKTIRFGYQAEMTLKPVYDRESNEYSMSENDQGIRALMGGDMQVPDDFNTIAVYSNNPHDPYLIDANEWTHFNLDDLLLMSTQGTDTQDALAQSADDTSIK